MDVDAIWQRVRSSGGQEFRLKGGKTFTFTAHDNYVSLDSTNRNISRTTILRALERVPLSGPGQVQDLSAPSYVFAILMDARVSQGDW